MFAASTQASGFDTVMWCINNTKLTSFSQHNSHGWNANWFAIGF